MFLSCEAYCSSAHSNQLWSSHALWLADCLVQNRLRQRNSKMNKRHKRGVGQKGDRMIPLRPSIYHCLMNTVNPLTFLLKMLSVTPSVRPGGAPIAQSISRTASNPVER
jgi:hypothetical protein